MDEMASGIVTKLEVFTHVLGEGQYLPTQKFLGWAMKGMLAAKSVILAQMGRRLLPGFATLQQVEKKLSYHVNNPRWDHEQSQQRYLAAVSRWARSASVYLALDLGEIAKSRARAMPYLDFIRDASRRGDEEQKRALGWWKVEIEAMIRRRGAVHHLPLEERVFSTEEPGFVSEAQIVCARVAATVTHVGKSAIWLADRGFDAESYLNFFSEHRLKFIIRSQGQRHAFLPGAPKLRRRVRDWVSSVVLTPSSCLLRRGRRYGLRIGYRPVVLPILPGQTLWLVVCEGFGIEPLMLMTNVEVGSLAKAVEMVEAYLARWGVEEGCRLVKQGYDLENVRCLGWDGIRRLAYMAMWCYGFLCLLALEAKRRLVKQLLELYPSFGPTPRFYYYRLVEAVAALLCPVPWAGFFSTA